MPGMFMVDIWGTIAHEVDNVWLFFTSVHQFSLEVSARTASWIVDNSPFFSTQMFLTALATDIFVYTWGQ